MPHGEDLNFKEIYMQMHLYNRNEATVYFLDAIFKKFHFFLKMSFI
jgi:hypothetical protein